MLPTATVLPNPLPTFKSGRWADEEYITYKVVDTLRLGIANSFLPMTSGLQLSLVVSIGVLFIIQKVLAYLRAANAIRSVAWYASTQRRTDHDQPCT
jgi:hypothetical protein